MQNIEEQALATYTRIIPLWLRYVDDTFANIFTNTLTDRTRTYSSPRTSKKMARLIPFLDCLVTHDNNRLRMTTYRKPTHTVQLLDQSSYNATSHKATTIWTLTRRAQLVCDSPDSLQDESDYNVFSKNNYNTDFVRWDAHTNTVSNTQTNINSGPVTTTTIPYVRGTSETIAHILQPYTNTCCTQTDNQFMTTTY